jgi:hypothetical protein
MPRVRLAACLLLAACGPPPAQFARGDCPFEEPLVCGAWEWESTSGGLAGLFMTPQTEGYSQTLELRPDSTFTLLRADTVAAQGQYFVGTQTLPFPAVGRGLALTWVEGQLPGLLRIEFPDPDVMVLFDTQQAGFQHEYSRIP